VLTLVLALFSVRAAEPGPPPAGALPEIPQPTLERLEPAVQERLLASRRDFERALARPGLTDEERGRIYGDMGRLYHAHYLVETAAACYRNAHRLAPQDFRWSYLLGVANQQTNQLEEAAEAFRQALRARPGDAPAMVRLAQVYLDLNALDRAATLFQEALERPGMETAAAAGLGKVELARRNYTQAVAWLQRALSRQPDAAGLYYPLAMAYRGLRDIDHAREYLARKGSGDARFPDPVVEGVEALSSGDRLHVRRAMKALDAFELNVAIKELRAALDIDPDLLSARIALARALYDSGQRQAARAEVDRVLARQPDNALANFFLGILAEDAGNAAEAIARFRRALAVDPANAGAHFHLADSLLREGRYREAAEHFRQVIHFVPQNHAAWLLEAVATVRGGMPQVNARRRLEEGFEAYPDDPVFGYMLARLLAASPDADARDGHKAVLIAQELYARYPLVENAETLAMAYAEVGEFEQAVQVQKDTLAMARVLGRGDLLGRLEAELQAYEESQPWREPWPADDSVLRSYLSSQMP